MRVHAHSVRDTGSERVVRRERGVRARVVGGSAHEVSVCACVIHEVCARRPPAWR